MPQRHTQAHNASGNQSEFLKGFESFLSGVDLRERERKREREREREREEKMDAHITEKICFTVC